jgi:uncharacterized protein (TIGR02646 family)
MIRIHRPAAVPSVLQRRGKAARDALCAEFDRAPQAYKDGERTFVFKSPIYSHPTVKNPLCQSQHGKCAFCESKVKAVAHGDVEHFRPKAGYQQQATDELGKPGYYWLAYEWTNLLFACQICNQQGKKNLFPLENPEDRAICHHDDPNKEKPLLIDPTQLDPERYIGFRKEVALARNGNSIGKLTIDTLGLNRDDLREARRYHLESLKSLHDAVRLLRDVIETLGDRAPAEMAARLAEDEALLNARKEDRAEYAAMIRCALR